MNQPAPNTPIKNNDPAVYMPIQLQIAAQIYAKNMKPIENAVDLGLIRNCMVSAGLLIESYNESLKNSQK